MVVFSRDPITRARFGDTGKMCWTALRAASLLKKCAMKPEAPGKSDSMLRIAMAILIALIPIFPEECCGCCKNQDTRGCSAEQPGQSAPDACATVARTCCQRAGGQNTVAPADSDAKECDSRPDSANAIHRSCCGDSVIDCSVTTDSPARPSSDSCPCCNHGHLPVQPLLSEPSATTTSPGFATYLFEPPAWPAWGSAGLLLGGRKVEVPPPSHNRQQALLCVWLN